MQKGHFLFLFANLKFFPNNFFINLFSIEEAYNWSLHPFGKEIKILKNTKPIYVRDAVTVQNGHVKCNVAQTEAL